MESQILWLFQKVLTRYVVFYSECSFCLILFLSRHFVAISDFLVNACLHHICKNEHTYYLLLPTSPLYFWLQFKSLLTIKCEAINPTVFVYFFTRQMCITDDVFGTVLSLYMHDSSQSLPTSEEVLICTSDTTAEEVGIESV